MECQNCGSDKLLSISGKVSDRFTMFQDEHEYNGYVPDGLEIGGGDYIEFEYCLYCGQIDGDFPVADIEWEGESDIDDE